MSEVVLHTGSPASERRSTILSAVGAAWGTSLLIVPDRRTARSREIELLHASGAQGCWGQVVYAFADFAAAMLQREGRSIQLLDAYGRLLHVERCLRQHDNLVATLEIDITRQATGLASHLLQVINSLKQAAIAPEAFAACTGAQASPLDTLVAAVYDAYQNQMREAGLYDVPGLYWEADLQCDSGRPRLLDGIDTIAFDSFDDFTPSELRLLEKLARQVPQTLIGLNYDPTPDRKDLYHSVAHTVAQIGERFAIKPLAAREHPVTSQTQYAAAHLYWRNRPAPHTAEIEQNLTVMPCTDMQHEAECIGRQIWRLIHNDGVVPSDIAITHRMLDKFVGPLSAVLREYGIPFRYEGDVALQHTLAGRFLQGLLESLERWEIPTVLTVLQSPLLDDPNGHSKNFPLLLRLARIHSRRQSWGEGLAWLAETLPTTQDKALAGWRAHVPTLEADLAALRLRIDQLMAWADALFALDSVRAMAQLLDGMINALDLTGGIARMDDGPRQAQEGAALQQVRRMLIQLADTLGDIGGMDGRAFVRLFLRGLAMGGLRATGDRAGIVLCDPSALRDRGMGHVFFAGLNEGIAPRRAPGNAIYTENDVKRLEERGIRLEGRWMHHARERLLFHHVLHSARCAVHLSWHYLAEDGREASPSAFLTDLYAVIPEADLRSGEVLRTDTIVAPAAAAASVRECRNGVYYQHPHDAMAAPMLGTRCAHGLRLELERQSPAPCGVYDGVLSDAPLIEAIATAHGPDHRFSVNQLETYGGCPFRFWKERILGIREETLDEGAMDALLRGNIVHNALQEFHQHFRGRPVGEIPYGEGREKVAALVRDAMEKLRRRHLGILPGVLHAEESGITHSLTRYFDLQRANDEPAWQPTYFEIGFGGAGGARSEEDTTPLIVEAGEETFLFSGRIDRADVLGDEIRLIDYKTGSLPTGVGIQRGDSLQLSVYLWAAAQLFWPDKRCTSACFVAVGKKKMVDALKIRHGDDREANAREAIARNARGIRQGNFPPVPSTKSCYGCGQYHGCRHEAIRIERKTGMVQDEEHA